MDDTYSDSHRGSPRLDVIDLVDGTSSPTSSKRDSRERDRDHSNDKGNPRKRKKPHDFREIVEGERETRERIATTSAREKTARERIKRQMAMDTERMRLEHARREKELDREHEEKMMRQRIELARLQQGFPTSSPSQDLRLPIPRSSSPLLYGLDSQFDPYTQSSAY